MLIHLESGELKRVPLLPISSFYYGHLKITKVLFSTFPYNRLLFFVVSRREVSPKPNQCVHRGRGEVLLVCFFTNHEGQASELHHLCYVTSCTLRVICSVATGSRLIRFNVINPKRSSKPGPFSYFCLRWGFIQIPPLSSGRRSLLFNSHLFLYDGSKSLSMGSLTA